MGRKDSRTTQQKTSANLPLTPPSSTKAKTAGMDTTKNEDMETLAAGMSGVKLDDTTPSKLKFKSFQNGTFITPNFVPPGSIQPLPPAKSASALCAESPSFVPTGPVKTVGRRTAQASPHSGSAPPAAPKDDRLGILQDRYSAPQNRHLDVENVYKSPPVSPYSPNLEKIKALLKSQPVGSSQNYSTNQYGGYGADSSTTKKQDYYNNQHENINKGYSTQAPQATYGYGYGYDLQRSPLNQLFHPLPVFAPPPPPQRAYLARRDPNRRDVEITATHIHHNLARMVETQLPDGTFHTEPNSDFDEPPYDLIKALQLKADDAQRQDFWECNWVEITLDFRNEGGETILDNHGTQITIPRASVIPNIRALGPELPMFVKNVYIVIKVPAIGKVDPSYRGLTRDQHRSWAFKEVESLITELDNFVNLQKVELTISTPSHTPSPLNFEQLNYVLPIYDLYFQEWDLKWKADYMSEAEPVQSWPISYLDREMHKIWTQRERDEANERKRIENATFVRRSDVGGVVDFPRLEEMQGRDQGQLQAKTPDSAKSASKRPDRRNNKQA